jgi:hypothetical protein
MPSLKRAFFWQSCCGPFFKSSRREKNAWVFFRVFLLVFTFQFAHFERKNYHFFWIQNSHLFPYSYHLFAIAPNYLFVAYKGLLVCYFCGRKYFFWKSIYIPYSWYFLFFWKSKK